MPRQRILEMPFARVYPLLVQKAERKGRTQIRFRSYHRSIC